MRPTICLNLLAAGMLVALLNGCISLPSDIEPARDVQIPSNLSLKSCEEIRMEQFLAAQLLARVVEIQLENRVRQVESPVKGAVITVSVVGPATMILGPEATVGWIFGYLIFPIDSITAWFARQDDTISRLKAELKYLDDLAQERGCR